jgi:DMSO reductase family type II enzyme iron-sulfur subunit
MTKRRQVRMVFDLNKCLGCQACTMACKTGWTDRSGGLQYQYWNNVETRPGRGYPRDWEKAGPESGFPGCGDEVAASGELIPLTEYGDPPWEYNYGEVLMTDGGTPKARVITPSPEPAGKEAWSVNWDEDVGEGTMPNTFYFYLPRICNHCTKPGCLAACPQKAIYKRPGDGVVLLDQERCLGIRLCNRGCPYKKTYFNEEANKSQKCIFCYPRLEKRTASFCFTQCSGRIRYVGYDDRPESSVNRLIDFWKVALRLHPEFGTEPNLYYIPPLSPPGFTPEGKPTKERRIPVKWLATLFGDRCDQPMEERVRRIEEIFVVLERERAKAAKGGKSELVDILTARTEGDRLQV